MRHDPFDANNDDKGKRTCKKVTARVWVGHVTRDMDKGVYLGEPLSLTFV